jgi:tyrosine-protein kinase Etk/Wzc
MHHPDLADLTSTGAGTGWAGHLRLLFHHWQWLMLSVLVSCAAGIIFLRYSTPKYEITASILVRDDTKGTDLGETVMLENLGLSGGKNNVDNEVEILRSRTLMEKVVSDLQLYIQYFASGRIKTTEIYDKSPFVIKYLGSAPVNSRGLPVTYTVTFKNNEQFVLSDNSRSWQQSLGDTFLLPPGIVTLVKTDFKPDSDDKYSIKIAGFEQTVKKYSQQLSVSVTNKQVSVISLKLTETLPFKGELILKKLIDNYLYSSITDKNRIADSTIAFIDQNLKLVSQELTGIEKQIEQFRTLNHITDINEQARLMLTNKSELDKENIETEVKLNLVQSLLDFIEKNPGQVIPSSVIMQQPDFMSVAEKYNNLQLTRDRAQLGSTSEHPVVRNLDSQLARLRTDLVNSVVSKKRELFISKNELTKNIAASHSQIRGIPSKERIFLDYARKQEIKQELYVFLLKKRVETSISKSSTLANGRIIDAAKADEIPVSPNKQLIFIIAVLLGISAPILLFYITDVFNTRITDKQEIADSVPVPVISEVGHSLETGFNSNKLKSSGRIAEQFRTLRTNIYFLSAVRARQVILITSSMSGEGKTFIAINLSKTLQLAGKKVILVEFDLRKPRIAALLDLKGRGITEYLISDIDPEKLIQPSGITDFDVLTCGFIPPNPAELILSSKIECLIDQLKANYDYVILDTPPIGLVTDARIFSLYADMSLYVVRQKFTFRHQLKLIEELAVNNHLPEMHIVLNDVREISGYGYTDGYYY